MVGKAVGPTASQVLSVAPCRLHYCGLESA